MNKSWITLDTQILILMFRLGCIFRTLGLNLIFYQQLAINILSQPAGLSQLAGIEMSVLLDTETVSCCGELRLWKLPLNSLGGEDIASYEGRRKYGF